MKVLDLIATNASLRQKGIEIPTDIRTFGQLSSFLTGLGHNIGGFKATWVAPGDPLHQSSPETPDANLPQVDKVWLSLSPHTTNKGAVSYNEMKAFVKEARKQAELNNDTATFQLIGDYTRLQASEMEKLYNRLQPVSVVGISESVVAELKDRIATLTRKVASLEARIDELEDSDDTYDDDNTYEENDVFEDDDEIVEEVPDEVKALWDKMGISY